MDKKSESRCALCGWIGSADGDQCPNCGHGLLTYTVVVQTKDAADMLSQEMAELIVALVILVIAIASFALGVFL